MLEENDMQVDGAPEDEGPGAPRQSHNFAPGYHGIVYRADVPDYGAGPAKEHSSGTKGSSSAKDDTAVTNNTKTDQDAHDPNHFILQSMKWGLVPFWTKRNPDYSSVMKTINCRDDSLAQNGGMWNTMKARKRCLVIAQGFYEWLKVGPKEKVPHYVKRKDGKLMCFAGLWDCVRYEEGEREGERNYTYTIITTDSNAQLKFLHDRMPVILDPGSEAMRIWLDPERHEWSKDLQGVLKPYEGELEVYPVSKEVGKVGNDSPSFIIPVASRENKGNIANFFANQGKPKGKASLKDQTEPEVEVVTEMDGVKRVKTESLDEVAKDADDGGMKREQEHAVTAGSKRRAESPAPEEKEPPHKKATVKSPSPVTQPTRKTRSATTNVGKSPAKVKAPAKGKEPGAQKITKFFGNSA